MLEPSLADSGVRSERAAFTLPRRKVQLSAVAGLGPSTGAARLDRGSMTRPSKINVWSVHSF
jgi:hypothetical protein